VPNHAALAVRKARLFIGGWGFKKVGFKNLAARPSLSGTA
jgi:hypothetical protein